MFHVKHFLAVISLLVMKCKLRYAIESIYYRYQGESLIYISFPIGICFKRVPVHSYPFPYLNPLPSSRARKRAAVRRYADNALLDCTTCELEGFRTCALEGFRTSYVSRETFWYHNFYKKGFHRPDFVIQ